MRPIDADALKDNMFHYAAPEMVWDRGDIEHKINEMQTIAAIPISWIIAYCFKRYIETEVEVSVPVMIEAWWKEQKATQ
jgi:hypothetical protein